MERMDLASRHMSNARRHLIAAHPDAHALALSEVRLALAALGAGTLDAETLDRVARLRAAAQGDAIDAERFMDAVDELASLLFIRELANA